MRRQQDKGKDDNNTTHTVASDVVNERDENEQGRMFS